MKNNELVHSVVTPFFTFLYFFPTPVATDKVSLGNDSLFHLSILAFLFKFLRDQINKGQRPILLYVTKRSKREDEEALKKKALQTEPTI